MKIPKIIHYCWFGGNPLPEKVKNCIKSWKKYCPDYEIIQWNETNYNVNKIRYIKEAYESGKWAFVSDYARLDVVYQYGGIYLDTDVELVKSPDNLLEESMFLAIEKQNCQINTGLGFGAEKENLLLYQLMELYHNISFIKEDGTLNVIACPRYTTDFFLKRGYQLKDQNQRIENCLILSSEYFCPMDFQTGVINMTEHTVGIHWFEASWFEKEDKNIHDMEMKIRQKCPNRIGGLLCFIYRKAYRLLEYGRKGILLKKIKEKMRRSI